MTTTENMNNKSFIHICRFVLVLLLVSVPFKAFAESTTYYANVKVEVGKNSTGLGTVYAGTSGTSTTQQLNSSTSGASVQATLRANPNEGYYLYGWNKDNTDNVISGSDTTPYKPNVNVATSDGTSNATNTTFYAVFKPYATYWAKLTVAMDSRNTGTGKVSVDGAYVNAVDKSGQGKQNSNAEVEFTLTAEPNPGCEFMGWSEVDGTGYISTENPYTRQITTTSTDKSSPAVDKLYAVFMKQPSITISITGSNYGLGENVVFNVNKTDSPTTSYTVPVRIASSNQVTIKNVPIGTYSVTANGWAWNYTVTPTTANTGVSVSDDTEFSFTVVGKGSTKEYDEKSKVNWGN